MPKKFKLTKENLTKLEIMNEILTIFVAEFLIKNLTDLNSLHYAAAITLEGTKETSSKIPRKQDPNKNLTQQIEKLRKRQKEEKEVLYGIKYDPDSLPFSKPAREVAQVPDNFSGTTNTF